jgi:arsenate reductase (thioredoxin)
MSNGVDLNEATRLHVEKAVDSLVEEFAGIQTRETIQRVMDDSLEQLVGDAQVDDFVPTLAHRFARERLKALGRRLGPESELPDIVFIGLGDTGRGQMAAALLTLRSEGAIVAHSAGSTAQRAIDAAVVEVMNELGIDLSEAYAKPLSHEVLEAADIVVTMGRSVGEVEIPRGTRHLDWRVGDPSGAPVAEVRRVRDDIDRRVAELIAALGGDEV